jgi:peptide/nickel transport system ATP-binding protein/oligopeptide transport system ATP-binding protein
MNRTFASSGTLLKVRGLRIAFGLGSGQLLSAVDGVDFEIAPGEILGLVGESGCGKTVLSHSLLRLIDPPGTLRADQILWQGQNLMCMSEREMRQVRGRQIALIFQNPQSALNPVYAVGKQLAAVLRLHRGMSREQARAEALELLKLVHVSDPERAMEAYPHQLSGGTCQRIMIAMALSCRPQLLIADEPTASLDVTIQAQIMDLLLELREQFGMAVLLISHDLGVIARMCDRIAVMYLGRIVENGDAVAIYGHPEHPYTRALLASVPVPDPTRRQPISTLPGDVPSAISFPSGCRFRTRCWEATKECAELDPRLVSLERVDHHAVACLHRTPVQSDAVALQVVAEGE